MARLAVNIEEEMKTSYLNYAMSVIVGRALPDVKDGLKPVQRRILYAMLREGLLPGKKYSKCAGVVGEVLKKYHPHGDSAVYEALVRLAQDFNMRNVLVDGQGNFGSVDGDPAAAYRYTEARLTRIAEEMLVDIDKETVDFIPNFDETTSEPVVLPAKVPNLIINGSSGIAVGMATNIPPHNLGEVVEGLLLLIDKPETTVKELMKKIKGPDFPTGSTIHGRQGIFNAYTTGRGLIKVRANVTIEDQGKNQSIIINELPYQVNKARLIEKIAELVRNKKIEGLSDLRDESDRQGIRVVMEVKRGDIPQVILNQLYKHTAMETTFGVIMLAIVNGQPKVLDLAQVLTLFLGHRRDVITRKTKFELRKAEEKAHILEGLKIALDNLDRIITLIRKSRSPQEALDGLMKKFPLSKIQAQAILDMKLQRLTGLEREKIITDYEITLKEIKRLKAILSSPALVNTIIRDELTGVKKKYADKRRTEITEEAEEITIEDLIQEEEMVITISHQGYIKRNPLALYRSQRRGGKGLIGMETRAEDFVEDLFLASTHDYVLFFTSSGRLFWLKVYQIPETGRAAKGKAIVNILQLSEGEKVTAVIPVSEFKEDQYLFMSTRKGVVKKTALKAYSNPRAKGIAAIRIDPDDELIGVRQTGGSDDIILSTRGGLSIRFNEKNVREMGRVARGVRGIKLRGDDEVVSVDVLDKKITLLTVTENGFGKRTKSDQYRVQSRGGKGILTIKVTEKNGRVVGVLKVTDDDEIIIIGSSGKLIRTKASNIRTIGRSTQGVKLMDLAKQDKVVSIGRVVEKDDDESRNNGGGSSKKNGEKA
ncbi:MAG TPA: DNA gyrase subunit A [Nitrospirae bacterium]|nr:DNA gyrase subunit A [bacterium BMS3Abin10]GBE37685.1 DNA gyrase subunit A [bacterium BMS3Bbin08]HDK41021.1 DNA gyrase subunit A [Nitrospirota bacterium]HDK82251.1 DNA gyrase subunit A [Nitrospirota bacterium]